MDKEWFYSVAAPFFESGVMYEIYSSDQLCICNIANQCYAVLSYKKNLKGVSGIFIHTDYVAEIIKDNSFVIRLINSDKNHELNGFYLNQANLLNFKRVKNYTDLNGPSVGIDYEMEEALKNGKGFSR